MKGKKILKLFVVMFLALIISISFSACSDDTKTYELEGVGNYKKNDDIIVKDVEVTQSASSAAIKCMVRNNHLHRIKYAAIYFRAYDEEGNFLGSTEDQIVTDELGFNDEQEFNVKINKVMDGNIYQIKLTRVEYRYYINYPKSSKTKRVTKDYVKEKDMKLIE